MNARVIITNNGQVVIFVDEGTFDDGKKKIEDFLAWLEVEGIELESQSQVEQHRHEEQLNSVKNSNKNIN